MIHVIAKSYYLFIKRLHRGQSTFKFSTASSARVPRPTCLPWAVFAAPTARGCDWPALLAAVLACFRQNSPGQRPKGVLDLQSPAVGFWKSGILHPPPSQWALELRMLTLNGARSTFEPSLRRFFGVSIFDVFFDTILNFA